MQPTIEEAHSAFRAYIDAHVARIEREYAKAETEAACARACELRDQYAAEWERALESGRVTMAAWDRYTRAAARALNLGYQVDQIRLLVSHDCNELLGEHSPYWNDGFYSLLQHRMSYGRLCDLRATLPPELKKRIRSRKPRKKQEPEAQARASAHRGVDAPPKDNCLTRRREEQREGREELGTSIDGKTPPEPIDTQAKPALIPTNDAQPGEDPSRPSLPSRLRVKQFEAVELTPIQQATLTTIAYWLSRRSTPVPATRQVIPAAAARRPVVCNSTPASKTAGSGGACLRKAA